MNAKQAAYILFITTLIVLLHSCYTDIDLEKHMKGPRVVLNCAVSPDSVVMVSVSRTWYFTEKNPNVSLPNADVKLFINGKFTEQMQWKDITSEGSLNAKGIYVSTIIPQAGDVVKVTATTEIGDAWAEDKVPNKTDILDIKLKYRLYDNGNILIIGDTLINTLTGELTYEITFEDRPEEENYYFLRIESKNLDEFSLLGLETYPLDYSSDPVFIGQESIFGGSFEGKFLEGRGGRTFSDETINGKRYTLKVKENYMPDYTSAWGKELEDGILSREVYLYELSKPYYQYLSALLFLMDERIEQNMADFGLSEPKKIFSNVHNGTGILGASNRTMKIAELKIEKKQNK